MLQYLMEKYDKKVQTLEDRALVANWVFFAYTSLVSSLPPGLQLPSCTRAWCQSCAQQTTVSASMLLGVGVAKIARERRDAEPAWSASPAAAARPGAPAQSRALHARRHRTCPRPLSAPASVRRQALAANVRGAPLGRRKPCSTRTSRARRSRRCSRCSTASWPAAPF